MNGVLVFMKLIRFQTPLSEGISKDAKTDGKRKAEDVDEGVERISHQAPQGNFEIVFEHGKMIKVVKYFQVFHEHRSHQAKHVPCINSACFSGRK
jgi:hypothetical protein